MAFSALSKSALSLKTFGLIFFTGFFIILGMWVLTAVFLKFFREDLRGLYLPIMFPNAGNMSMPLCLFAFGQEGLQPPPCSL